mmetsp:Transcript_3342/g.10129  ORF Transcript_3342/g.10129 Transcript_3342/m.10129 type:complete len:216 (+) Transcript_3342:1182-1829(+)
MKNLLEPGRHPLASLVLTRRAPASAPDRAVHLPGQDQAPDPFDHPRRPGGRYGDDGLVVVAHVGPVCQNGLHGARRRRHDLVLHHGVNIVLHVMRSFSHRPTCRGYRPGGRPQPSGQVGAQLPDFLHTVRDLHAGEPHRGEGVRGLLPQHPRQERDLLGRLLQALDRRDETAHQSRGGDREGARDDADREYELGHKRSAGAGASRHHRRDDGGGR